MNLRSLFISDVHLGSRESQAAELLQLLRAVQVEQLFLVGDVVDFLSLRRRLYWPAEHAAVLGEICGMARRGTRVIYVPGNHDAAIAQLTGLWSGAVELHAEYVHETRAGQRLLVTHGDRIEEHVRCPRWLTWLGATAYDITLSATHWLNRARAAAGCERFALIAWLKRRIPVSARYILRFEHAATDHARHRGFDGIVCGHIHEARLQLRDGTLYANTGDWVESCTALLEDHSGMLSLWRRPVRAAGLSYDSPAVTVPAATLVERAWTELGR